MKRIFFLYFLWALCLFAPMLGQAAPWGILKEMPEETSFSVYAVDNLIDKRPIRYAVSKEVTPDEEAIFKANILKWPQETLRFIQQSGRTQEFADIVPILQHVLVLKKVFEQESPDIVLSFYDDPNDGKNGYFTEKDDKQPFSEIRINQNSRDGFEGTSLHEIGHYFGLGDQYDSGRNKNSHTEYSSDVADGSIMLGDYTPNKQLTCDDVDGFINLIDLRLAQRHNNQFSRRAQKGWKSLCPGKNIYQEARTINRNEIDQRETSDYVVHKHLREYKNGKLQQEIELRVLSPMEIFNVNRARVERDSQMNLIQAIYTTKRVSITLPNGTTSTVEVPYERHFSYGQPKQEEGKESVEIILTEMLNGKKFNSRVLYIQSNGMLRGLPNVSLETADFYYAYTDYVAIDFYYADGFLSPSRIVYYTVDDTEHDIKLQGKWGENTATVTRNGQTERISLPPAENDDMYMYWGLMELNKESFESYIKNFYMPLFGTQSKRINQAQQVRDQVKQALNSSH